MNENIVKMDDWTDGEKNAFVQGISYTLIEVLKTELDVVKEARLAFPKEDLERKEAALKTTKIMYKQFEETIHKCDEYIAKVQGYDSYRDLLQHYATIYGKGIEA